MKKKRIRKVKNLKTYESFFQNLFRKDKTDPGFPKKEKIELSEKDKVINFILDNSDKISNLRANRYQTDGKTFDFPKTALYGVQFDFMLDDTEYHLERKGVYNGTTPVYRKTLFYSTPGRWIDHDLNTKEYNKLYNLFRSVDFQLEYIENHGADDLLEIEKNIDDFINTIVKKDYQHYFEADKMGLL